MDICSSQFFEQHMGSNFEAHFPLHAEKNLKNELYVPFCSAILGAKKIGIWTLAFVANNNFDLKTDICDSQSFR